VASYHTQIYEEAVMAEPIRHKRGLLGGCDAHAGSETSVGTLQVR
jgi:hypothetical protein